VTYRLIFFAENPKLRVAAYCRMSTDSDEQSVMCDAMIEHYTNYINGHPGFLRTTLQLKKAIASIRVYLSFFK